MPHPMLRVREAACQFNHDLGTLPHGIGVS